MIIDPCWTSFWSELEKKVIKGIIELDVTLSQYGYKTSVDK